MNFANHHSYLCFSSFPSPPHCQTAAAIPCHCQHHSSSAICRYCLPPAACHLPFNDTLSFACCCAIRQPPPPPNTTNTILLRHCTILIHYQIRRRADAAFEAATPSRRRRERGHESRYRSRSCSPYRAESSRKRRRSPSPHDTESPSDCREKRSRISTTFAKRSEFFQSGAGPRGGVCAACLGRHDHPFAKCEGAKLWDGTPSAARKNDQGRLVAMDGLPICFDWQVPCHDLDLSFPLIFLPLSPTYSPYVIALLFHHTSSSYLLYITHY